MSTTVTLKVRDHEGNIINKQHEIEAINGFQFEAVMKVINSIMKDMQQDESLKGLFSSLFGDQDVREMDLAKLNSDLLMNAVNSFESLFIHMPGKAYELLAVLSNIEVDILKSQKFEDIPNFYDAVLEQNDIERLINRVKKSLALTQTKMKFMSLLKRATASDQTQQ